MRVDSTRIVAATTLAAGYLRRSSSTCSTPLRSGTSSASASTCGGTLSSACVSWVDFTVTRHIHRVIQAFGRRDRHRQLAEALTGDPQPAFTQRRNRTCSGQAGDAVAGDREQAGKQSADAAGAEHGNAQRPGLIRRWHQPGLIR